MDNTTPHADMLHNGFVSGHSSARIPSRHIGYARVSTEEQSLSLQINALKAAGCELIFEDHGFSGATIVRPGLVAALESLEQGDIFVVWRLDRLGRSLRDLIQIVNNLASKGVNFRSLSESINTASSSGRLIFHIMGALAEFERALISERTRAGMHAAKRQGKHLGRPPSLTNSQLYDAKAKIDGGKAVKEVANILGIHPRTLQRILKRTQSEG